MASLTTICHSSLRGGLCLAIEHKKQESRLTQYLLHLEHQDSVQALRKPLLLSKSSSSLRIPLIHITCLLCIRSPTSTNSPTFVQIMGPIPSRHKGDPLFAPLPSPMMIQLRQILVYFVTLWQIPARLRCNSRRFNSILDDVINFLAHSIVWGGGLGVINKLLSS